MSSIVSELPEIQERKNTIPLIDEDIEQPARVSRTCTPDPEREDDEGLDKTNEEKQNGTSTGMGHRQAKTLDHPVSSNIKISGDFREDDEEQAKQHHSTGRESRGLTAVDKTQYADDEAAQSNMQSSTSIILMGGEQDSNLIKEGERKLMIPNQRASVGANSSRTKVAPLEGLPPADELSIGKGSLRQLASTSGVLRKLKEAVANKIGGKAVFPLEKQSAMRASHRYKPSWIRQKLAYLMGRSSYDIFIAVICCLYSLVLVSLIIMEDYINLESSAAGFRYAQYAILGAFLFDNLLSTLAYRSTYISNDPYVLMEIGAAALCILFVWYDESTAPDFAVRVIKFGVIFRKLHVCRQKEKMHYYHVIYDPVSHLGQSPGIVPQHKVLNILNFVRHNFDMVDHRLRADWVYVIRQIASGKLYSVDFHEQDNLKSQDSEQPLHHHHGNKKTNVKAEAKKGATQTGMQWAREMTKINTQKNQSVNRNSFKNQLVAKRKSSNKRQTLVGKDILKNLNLKSHKLDALAVSEMLQLNKESREQLDLIETYDFNIFKLSQHTKNNELATVVCHILAKEDLFDILPIETHKFLPFMQELSSRYKDITYHNKTHAADLSQTFYYFCMEGELKQKCDLDSIEMFSYILAGACHDVEHPGFNNVFLIEKHDSIAINYNDVSVLENHHVATTFQILGKQKFNILKKFEKDDYKRVRKLMIEAILATDMAQHFNKSALFKNKLTSEDFDPQNPEQKLMLCTQLFHLADISNSTKKFDICFKWCELLFVEFYNQGDMEKQAGMNVSMFMDRCTTNIEQSQIGFIDFIIKPSFTAAQSFLPKILDCVTNCERNKSRYEKSIAKGAHRMEEEKKKVALQEESKKEDKFCKVDGTIIEENEEEPNSSSSDCDSQDQ